MDKHLLSWDVQKDLGFYPVDETWYDKAYFEVSIKNAKSPIASELNEFRTTLVNSFTTGLVLDFGVGCGQFLHWRKNCLGYDICPQAVAKLRKEGLFFDPYEEDLDERGIEGVTFFDSLEHLRAPEEILKRITKQYVFVSLPIFQNKEHVFKSRHFKPREHWWYFTHNSMRRFIKECGFKMLDCRNDETYLGRVDIYTFIFRRA